MEDIKKVLESKTAMRIIYGIGVLIIAMVIFSAGVTVGFHKASYGRAWAEHYNENFGMGYNPNINHMGMMPVPPNFGGGYFPNAHGATGKIIRIELPNIIVEDKENTEKVISTTSNTIIQKDRTNITPADLKIDDFIVAIGEPNDSGVIEAKLIRAIPSPEFLTQ